MPDLGGFLGYIAIFMMATIWVLGWVGLTVLLGSFFDLPMKTSATAGAVLGPLGFIMVIFVGGTSKARRHVRAGVTYLSSVGRTAMKSGPAEDPFA